MESHRFLYLSSEFHYATCGNGPVPLVAFHGYGRSGTAFSFLENDLPPVFTLIAIDLPLHGQTRWNEMEPLDPGLFASAVLAMLQTIPGIDAGRIHLLGYSLGGRVCLTLIPFLAPQLERVTLIAADGLTRSKILQWAVSSPGGNRVFRKYMNDPAPLFRIINLAARLRLLRPRRRKFMLAYLESPESRDKLYRRWTLMQHFNPAREKVKRALKKHGVPLSLVFGIDDPVIDHNAGAAFLRGFESNCKRFLLQGGHHLLNEENLPSIIPLL